MRCREAEDLLSAYFDDELSPETRAEMDQHVAQCARCQGELASFHKLSTLAEGLVRGESPDVWTDIERSLARPPAASPPLRDNRGKGNRVITWALVTAASLMIGLVGLWMFDRLSFRRNDERSLASRLDPFLAEFAKDPDNAERILLAKYSGKSITFDDAIQTLKYEPVANRGLPDGYRVDSVHVLDMPCCPCLLTAIEGMDGRRLLVIEHDGHHSAVSSKLPSITTDCHGTETKIVQMGRQLAAVWSSGERCVTLVGPDEIDEIVALVDHLEGGSQNGS